MKKFLKIVKTFFLVLFILIIGIAVGYAVHYYGYDKVIIGAINPAWVQTEVKTDTIVDNVDNTNIANTWMPCRQDGIWQ